MAQGRLEGRREKPYGLTFYLKTEGGMELFCVRDKELVEQLKEHEFGHGDQVRVAYYVTRGRGGHVHNWAEMMVRD